METINKYLTKCELYQDIVVNGEVVKKGKRSCDDRYEYIKSLITIQERPFTVLDIGANFGYYSIRLAQDFPNSYVVMVQHGIEAQVLREIIELNTSINDRLCLLNATATAKNMSSLSLCEHFDYIMCNNVLHHMSDYKVVYQSLKNMCKYLIIETPPVEDKRSIGQNKLQNIYDMVNKECTHKSERSFIRHTDKSTVSHFYFFSFSEEVTKSIAYYDGKNLGKKYRHRIYDGKRIFEKTERGGEISIYSYIHGINLKTFVVLNGIYPSIKWITEMIQPKKLKTEYAFDNSLRDINYWNFILNENLHLIDITCKDHGDNIPNDRKQIDNVVKFLLSLEYKQIKS